MTYLLGGQQRDQEQTFDVLRVKRSHTDGDRRSHRDASDDAGWDFESLLLSVGRGERETSVDCGVGFDRKGGRTKT